jgi:hypothetical protein
LKFVGNFQNTTSLKVTLYLALLRVWRKKDYCPFSQK